MFTTKSNYNNKGNEQDLLVNRSYSLMSGRLWGAMDWDERMRFYLGGGYAKATSNNGLGTGEQSASGFTDLEARAYLEAGFRPWIFMPYARVLVPVQKVGIATRTPIYAEGAVEAELGARLGYTWHGLTPYVESGLRYMDEGRATLLPWHLGANYQHSFFLVGAEVYGQEVLKKDSKSDDPRDKVYVTDYANGGSLKFYAVDQYYYEVRGYVGADLMDSLLLRLGFGQTILGKNAAAGQTIYASLEFRFAEEKSDPRQDRFEGTPESYDQKLFQEEVMPSTKRKKSKALEKDFENIKEADPVIPPQKVEAERDSVPVQQRPVQPKARATKPKAKTKPNALDEEFETMKTQKPRPPRPTKKQIQLNKSLDDIERDLERKKIK